MRRRTSKKRSTQPQNGKPTEGCAASSHGLRFPFRIAAALLALIVIAFASSFSGQFVFDDLNEIANNPAFKRMPLWRAMFAGRDLPARPLPYLTFAIDYRLHGNRVFGYHASNLFIHAIASLALFDLVRTTLRSPRIQAFADQQIDILAGIVAAIWAVHPLQTQAVTYVYQRIESMAGMFVLVSLAAWARAGASGWNPRYAAAAVIAAAAAMASKESAVVLPFLAVAYDWCYWDRDGWHSRRPWYALLFATWIVVVATIWNERAEFQEFESASTTPLAYLFTQGGVILHYLRLAAWPDRQCIDYRWPIAADWTAALPACLVVFAGVFAGIVALATRRSWAFPLVFYFLTLAPTSSILPVEAAAAEHRMYLPLAGVATIMTLAADQFLRRRVPDHATTVGPVLAAIVITALAARTFDRNRIYAVPAKLWAEAVDRNPANATAQARLAEVIFNAGYGDIEQAFSHAEAAVAADPQRDVFRNLLLACDRPDTLTLQERLARRAWQQASRGFGPQSADALDAAGGLITALRNVRSPEAADLAIRFLPAMHRVLGPNHLTTMATSVIAAEAALGQGDAVTAADYARASWAVLMQCEGRPPPLVRRNATVLAESLRQLDRLPEAEQVLRFAFKDLGRAGAELELPIVAEALADVLAARGSRSEAVVTYRQLAAAAKAAGAEDIVRRLAEKIQTVTAGGKNTGE